MIKQIQTTIVPSLSFPVELEFLEELFITNYMTIFRIITFFLNITPDFAPYIPLSLFCLMQLTSATLILIKET